MHRYVTTPDGTAFALRALRLMTNVHHHRNGRPQGRPFRSHLAERSDTNVCNHRKGQIWCARIRPRIIRAYVARRPTPIERNGGLRADLAYDKIREAIVQGRYAGGERMREAEIAGWLHISRTPVRDALRRLESDGLLVAAPRRGLVVTELNEHQLADLFVVRKSLAALAARLAAKHATALEVSTMREMLDREGRTPQRDTRGLVQVNNAFHQLIYRAARNPYLNAVLRSLESSLSLIPSPTYLGSRRPQLAVRQHRALVDAIAAHDPGAAEARAIEHMEASEEIMHRMLSAERGLSELDRPPAASTADRRPTRSRDTARGRGALRRPARSRTATRR